MEMGSSGWKADIRTRFLWKPRTAIHYFGRSVFVVGLIKQC
jgi:hypothetical protein